MSDEDEDETEDALPAPLRRPKRLKNLRVFEASLVDKPANPHSKLVLYKREDPAAESGREAAGGCASEDDGNDLTAEERQAIEKALDEGAARGRRQAARSRPVQLTGFTRAAPERSVSSRVEGATMESETLRKMLSHAPDTPSEWSKEEVFAQVVALSEDLFPTEDQVQAVDKTLLTPRGKRLHRLYVEARSAPVRKAEPRQSGRGRVWGEITAQADKLWAAQPDLRSREQAVEVLLRLRPDLVDRYYAAGE